MYITMVKRYVVNSSALGARALCAESDTRLLRGEAERKLRTIWEDRTSEENQGLRFYTF